jgi:hypothetical protein
VPYALNLVMSPVLLRGTSRKPNRHYYRELIHFVAQRSAYKTFRFGLKNLAQQGVRDIYMDMRTEAITGQFKLVLASLPPRPPSKFTYEGIEGVEIGSSNAIVANFISNVTAPGSLFTAPDQTPMMELKEDVSDGERLEMTLPIVQVGRTVLMPNEFTIETNGSPAVGVIHGTGYSSNFQPFKLRMNIEIQFIEHKMPYQEILEEAQKLLDVAQKIGDLDEWL